jgi:hypothetical protein
MSSPLLDPGLDRRGFLRLAGAAAAVGALPGCLSPDRRDALVTAVTRRIVGPEGAARIDAGLVDPAATAAAFLANLGPLGDALELALVAVEWSAWPLVPKLRPFTALGAADQDAVLADLRDSRLGFKRQLFAAAKSVGCLAYYASPESHVGLGYPGPFGDNAAAMRWSDEG